MGIRKYRDLNGPRFADNDARQVQRLLTRMGGFRNDRGRIRLRVDGDATIGTLYGDLHWLLTKAKLNPDAKILFCFSGHGSPVLGHDRKTIKDGLLVPYEASLDNLNDRTAVSLAYLKRKLGKLPNRDVVCVIDACFSGSGKSVSGMKLIRPEVAVNLLSSNRLFISASAAGRLKNTPRASRGPSPTFSSRDSWEMGTITGTDGWTPWRPTVMPAKSWMPWDWSKTPR